MKRNNQLTISDSDVKKLKDESESEDNTTLTATDKESLILLSITSQKEEPVTHFQDIGLYLNKNLRVSDDNRYKMLNRPWFPANNYKYPTFHDELYTYIFQEDWFDDYKWLAYSDHVKGALCKVCVLFPNDCNKGIHSALIKKPLTNWKTAIRSFDRHIKTEYHKLSTVLADKFKRNMDDPDEPTMESIARENIRKEQLLNNRVKLYSVIETIILCCRQDITMRGYSGREFGRNYEANDGNLSSLISFKAQKDTVLRDLLDDIAYPFALYTNLKVQNAVIHICEELIQKHLITKFLKYNKIFSILVHKTQSVYGIEQMAICMRYVSTMHNLVIEDFLGFIMANDLTGKGLSTKIMQYIKKLGLKKKFLVGQGYDGASSMNGHFYGVENYIEGAVPYALNVHCAMHSLNLAILSSCKIASLRNCFGSVISIAKYLKSSAQRTSILIKYIQKYSAVDKQQYLINMCKTQWVEGHDGITHFKELFIPIYCTLKQLENFNNNETSSSAFQLSLTIKSLNFGISMYIIEYIFDIMKPLSISLQKTDADLINCYKEVDDVRKKLIEIKNNSDVIFQNIFETFEKEILYKIESVQFLKENTKAESPKQYYEQNLFLPLLDHFIVQLDERFSKHRHILSALQLLIPKYIVQDTTDLKTLNDCALFYKRLLPSFDTFEAEIKIWKSFWETKNKCDLPNCIMETIDKCNSSSYPNVKCLLIILCTLPVSNIDERRTYSAIRELKSLVVETTGKNTIPGVALMNIYRNYEIDINEVINRFAKLSDKCDFEI